MAATAGANTDGRVLSDVDVDVTMSSPGSYSATVELYGIENGGRAGTNIATVQDAATAADETATAPNEECNIT